MTIDLVAAYAALLLVIARAAVALKRKEPLLSVAFIFLLLFFSGVSCAIGICLIPYLAIHAQAPELLPFYKDWLSSPIFLMFAGLAYLLVGVVGAIRLFARVQP